jgi:hypothetical protein
MATRTRTARPEPIRVDVPVPHSVREWNRYARAAQRRANAAMQDALAEVTTAGEAMALIMDSVTSSLRVPANVLRDYEQYHRAWYAERDRQVAQRQAAANAREVNAMRAAACPSCFATHPGEC